MDKMLEMYRLIEEIDSRAFALKKIIRELRLEEIERRSIDKNGNIKR